MATVVANYIEQIGETAGIVWHTLDEHGSLSIAKLVKSCGVPRDLAMQALGWLARENKIEVEESNRGKIVSLRPE